MGMSAFCAPYGAWPAHACPATITDATATRMSFISPSLLSTRRAALQLASHEIDLLLLLDNNALREPAHDRVVPELQFGLRHVDRALMVGNHHRGKVPIGIATMGYRHVLAHPLHRFRHQPVERGLRRGTRRPGMVRVALGVWRPPGRG